MPARREDGEGWEVFVNGGRMPTGLDAVEWVRRGVELGAGEILLTSMDRDGTEDGYELELTRAASDAVEVPVIASGGAGSPDHLVEAVREGGADAVLCASIFHYGQLQRARGEGAHARRRDPGAALMAALAAARRDAARGGGGDDRRAPPEREGHEADEGLDRARASCRAGRTLPTRASAGPRPASRRPP